MTRGVPFWLKLFGAFMAVIIVAVGGVAVLANRSASSEFTGYIDRGQTFRAQAIAYSLEVYYQQAGSWDGAAALAQRLAAGMRQGGMGRKWGAGQSQAGIGAPISAPAGQIVIADPNGEVVVDLEGTLLGRKLSDEDLQYGIPLVTDGQLRGYLLAGEFYTGTAEADLLRNLNQALLMAAGLAGGAALLLALLLSRGLSGPLRALAGAARQLAQGKRGLRVQAAGGGEVALLGQSFNAMAESLEQQEALRRQLVADIAHELRTPLAVIQGNLEAILDGIYKPSVETIAPIHEETLQLARLVDELRDLSLAEAGQLPLNKERVDAADLVRGVLSGFQAHANERSIELPLVLPAAHLPPIEVDPGRIRQVLSNLLANALRYVPQRGRVCVGLQRVSPNWVEVSVSDNGPGISPEDLPHVFDRFYRSDRARTRHGSAGLGLAIARQWVEAHGGSIWVDSVAGQGTAFHFTVPVSKRS